MSENLQDKVVVITGAAGGFGRLVALKVTALGAKAVISDVNQSGLDAVLNEIHGAGGNAIACPADVTDLGQMRQLADQAIAAYQVIDVMINNAGIMPLAFFADQAEAYDAWDKCIDINIKGVLHGILAVHDHMLQQGRGHVINLSSIYGNFPVVGAGVYGATKAAVNFLSESLRQESQGRIKVTVIKPTGVPSTGLSAGVVNPDAVVGILGQNAASFGQMMQAQMAGELPAEHTDPAHIEYYALDPEYLADQIVYAINQPWGISISDVTVRASGDAYLL